MLDIFRKEAQKVRIALDDPQLIVDNDHGRWHLLQQRIRFFLRQLARIRGAHHAFSVAGDERMRKVAARLVAAPTAVQLVFG